jgi:hypothetical protein
MRSLLALTAPVLLLVTLASPALAQTQGGGGSSPTGGGGEGANEGVAATMNCLTGAYCPPHQPQQAFGPDGETCDLVRFAERIPGRSRTRIVYRCVDRFTWGRRF